MSGPEISLESASKSSNNSSLNRAQLFDSEKWIKNGLKLRSNYLNADPFPSIFIDDFLNPEALALVGRSYSNVDWQTYKHFNENKQGGDVRSLPAEINSALAELNSPDFLKFLTALTGIENLIPDTTLGSGGIHQSERGGYLNIHADFTVHPYRHDWRRRLNVLVYLNEQWPEDWGAQLELWSRDMSACKAKITPIFNRCVVFSTDETSFHGHPEPMTSPEGVKRKSIALYYYTEEKNVRAISTEYRPRPKDSFGKSLMIFADKMALRVFHKIKATFNLPDSTVTTFMDFFGGKKKK